MSNLTTPGQEYIDGTGSALTNDYKILIFIRVVERIVLPIFEIVGIVGNSLSFIILFKHGFRKSSNILLFVLAVSDLTHLLCGRAFDLVYRFSWEESVRYSKLNSRVMLAFFQIFRMASTSAEYMSLCMPCVITIERLIAVFFPLRFPHIVTPFRVWLLTGILSTVWFIKFCHSSVSFFELNFTWDPVLNKTVGTRVLSEYYIDNFYFHYDVAYAVVILGTTVPSVVTAVGCLVISVKIRYNAMKRKKMTSSAQARSTSQTTRTMLTVCFIYLVTCTYNWITNIPQVADATVDGMSYTDIGLIVTYVYVLFTAINFSSNFIIYVCLNKKFRDTFIALFTCGPGGDASKKTSLRK